MITVARPRSTCVRASLDRLAGTSGRPWYCKDHATVDFAPFGTTRRRCVGDSDAFACDDGHDQPPRLLSVVAASVPAGTQRSVNIRLARLSPNRKEHRSRGARAPQKTPPIRHWLRRGSGGSLPVGVGSCVPR
jgi:hypothetical protein